MVNWEQLLLECQKLCSTAENAHFARVCLLFGHESFDLFGPLD
jgi:hypothetical protein